LFAQASIAAGATFREQPGLTLANPPKEKDDSMAANKTRKSDNRGVNYDLPSKKPQSDETLLEKISNSFNLTKSTTWDNWVHRA